MENEGKKIELPRGLGLAVWKILKEEHNIEPRKNKVGLIEFHFTEEELGLIKKIEFTNPAPGNLQGISLLPKLQTLNIKSHAVTAHLQQKDIPSITDAEINEIQKCTSLKNLSIVNQAKVGALNVSKLKNLQQLVVTHNQHLDEIWGMEELENLWILECYGNNRLHSIKNLDKVIQKNQELSKLDLDVLLFPNAIGYNTNTGEYNRQALEQIQDMQTTSWKESLNGNRAIKINTNQMIQLHNKACKINAENIPSSAEIRDTIIGIEMYLARNVKYDYDAMEKGHTSGYMVDNVRIVKGPAVGANGAYNALVDNKCVCEGYTRGMQYLLKLRGINSHNVDCYGEPDTTYMASNKEESKYTTYRMPDSAEYHSIICIDDYDYLYDDPCWNACYYQQGDKSMPWLLKTKEEISQDHTLSFDERYIENNLSKQPSDIIQASIQRNDLFRAARTRQDSVNSTRNTIKQQVKGQIIQERE